jgi:hypothetical protein
MPSLPEIQRSFAAALSGDDSALVAHVLANGIDPAVRIRVYRNNARETLVATLRAAFPILERLVGEDYFRQLALEYRERFPSRSGDLHHIGERLAEFLAQRFAESRYRYFADIARLEWAYQEVMVAADHDALPVERLREVPAADYARLQFRFHPAVRLVASAFPVLRIWSANQPGGDADQVIDLDGGGENVLLARTAHDVELRLLDIAEFTFLKHTANGVSLAQAADLASEAGDFDLGATLRRQVASGVLVDFTLSDRQP